MCECKSCQATEKTEVQAFIHRVHSDGVGARAGFWTGWSQGVLCALEGRQIPEQVQKGCHSVDFDFRGGYKAAKDGSYHARCM